MGPLPSLERAPSHTYALAGRLRRQRDRQGRRYDRHGIAAAPRPHRRAGAGRRRGVRHRRPVQLRPALSLQAERSSERRRCRNRPLWPGLHPWHLLDRLRDRVLRPGRGLRRHRARRARGRGRRGRNRGAAVDAGPAISPVCLAACGGSAACGPGFVCQQIPGGGGGDPWVQGCLPLGARSDFGNSCRDANGVLDDAACTTGLCADVGALGLCSAACDSAHPCPAGAACARLTGTTDLCLPACSAAIPCTAIRRSAVPWRRTPMPGSTAGWRSPLAIRASPTARPDRLPDVERRS